ncbi:hypothetical protein CROQUDRAFT_50053, partial [Cronartium quercuum f. sp. fusiforme G11]
PIELASIAWQPSKEFKLYTHTRPMACWLLNNKHKWTHLFCPELKSYLTRFPVILHAVLNSFNPTSPSHLQRIRSSGLDRPDLTTVCSMAEQPG